jgi:hypothetical protein
VVLPAAEPIYARVAAIMQRQHYPSAAIMANESLVRALVVLYAGDHGGRDAANFQLVYEQKRGFAWTAELARAIGALPRPLDGDAVAAATRDVMVAWSAAHPP